MSAISFRLPTRAIQDVLQQEADDYVKHVMEPRRTECLEAIAEVLESHGYLPNDTTWEVYANQLYFYVLKGENGEDLAHYFHEGWIYGPNYPVYEVDERGNKTLTGFRSPAGKFKYPIYEMGDRQGPNKPSGVAHWTDAVRENGALWQEVLDACREILRR